MKNFLISIFAIILLTSVYSCKKDYVNYPEGYDRMYYAFFDYNYADPSRYNRNQTVSFKRSSPDLLPIKVKFESSFIRDYDVVVKMYVQEPDSFFIKLNATNINLAKPNIDYQILDSSLNVLEPVSDGDKVYYQASFPKAKKAIQTFYLKSLNNTSDDLNKTFFFSFSPDVVVTNDTEERYLETALNNETPQYSVLTYSGAYYRKFNINK